MANESFLAPSLKGQTVEELRREVQFTLQQLANHLDEASGKRGTPAFYADIDTQGHRIKNVSMPQSNTDPQLAGLSLGRAAFTGAWDAQGQPIENLPRGEQATSNVNFGQLQQLLDAKFDVIFPIGMILLWSGTVASIPGGWQLCDGTNSTPDLQDQFVVGAGSTYAPGDTGGANTVDLSHTHTPGTLGTDTDSTGPSSTVAVDQNLDGSTVVVANSGHTHSHAHTVTTGATATALSAVTENRPPYYALAYIMKVA